MGKAKQKSARITLWDILLGQSERRNARLLKSCGAGGCQLNGQGLIHVEEPCGGLQFQIYWVVPSLSLSFSVSLSLSLSRVNCFHSLGRDGWVLSR